AERARLEGAGLSVTEIERADYTDIMRLRDPDGNLVVLAHPHA
ncbi:glyoxalase/bleomycin resistance/dioxygenase family protein, partial [Halomonas sp. ND22Bw]